MPGAPATLVLQLSQCFQQCITSVHRLCEWRRTFSLLRVVAKEIQIDTGCAALARHQGPPASDDEGDARNSVQALVRRGGASLDIPILEVDLFAAKTRHTIQEQRYLITDTNVAERGNVIEPACGGLMMHGQNMRDVGVARQNFLDRSQVHW